MNIYINNIDWETVICNNNLNSDYVAQFKIVDKRIDADAAYFHKIDYNDSRVYQQSTNTVYNVDAIKSSRYLKNNNIRAGDWVDQKLPIWNKTKNILMTSLDVKNDNIIPTLMPYTPGKFISKDQYHWMTHQIPTNESYHGKVFWSGSRTHQLRGQFLDFYKNINDDRFSISNFVPPTGDLSIYKIPVSKVIYNTYMNNLTESDIVYIIRGDRPSTCSTLDALRAGCIPVFINCTENLGWHHIFKDPDNFRLSFNINNGDTFESIHEQVVELLQNKERVLFMKSNVRKFYDTFFKDKKSAWEPFYFAKVIDLYNKRFKIRSRETLFSPEVMKLYGVDSKI